MGRKFLYLMIFLSSGCATTGPSTPAPVQAPARAERPERAERAERAERSEALLQALLSVGLDYRRGGTSPESGFDCSGLVAHVYERAWGIRLPRNTAAQSEAGVPVSLAELQAGDLVFYDTLRRPYSHVGIYLGDGKFVHAPRTGAQVRIESVRSTYWLQRFNGARRIEPSL